MSDQNVEVVRRGLEAFNRGDFDAVLELIDPEIEWHDSPDLPDAGTHHGHEAVRKLWQAVHETLEGFHAKAERFFDAGDQVVVFLHVGGTGRESRISVDRNIAHVWTIRDGKGLLVEVYPDRAEALAAVGIRDQG